MSRYIKLVTQSWNTQGRLLGKGLVPSLLLFLHQGGWFYMHSNDLLKNFPTKRWGKIFLQKNKQLRIGYLFFQKGFTANLCFSFASWVSDITELIKQLLKLYEGLTERYRERINWLEEDCNDNSCRCQPVPVDEGCNQGQEQGRGLEFLSRKSKD